MVIFRQRSSSVKGRFPSKVVFCQRLSSVKGPLPSKVVFRQRSSSVKVIFHQRLSSVKGRFPSKASSMKGRPSKGVFHQSFSSILTCCRSESSNYKLVRLDKTFFDKQRKQMKQTDTQSQMLVLLRTTKIPSFSLLEYCHL